MNQQVLHLQHLISDLGLLSLADAGTLPINRREVEPGVLLEQTALTFMPIAEKQAVALRVEAPDDLPMLSVDIGKMTQVLNNLVGNALRYTPEGGEVILSASYRSSPKPRHILLVCDTGSGIPSADLSHIFDRFYRVDKSRQRADGESGLGLAIVKSIVEAHGGSISVQSAPGQGTTFSIEL
ncbi:MAG: cell wall metabolism sensor histidine kinase WalK [Anaerolineaceae bacterium]|nr:cell wall metabolism sensor histidine kinase WalK [Anaerolineaceae bacterium]